MISLGTSVAPYVRSHLPRQVREGRLFRAASRLMTQLRLLQLAHAGSTAPRNAVNILLVYRASTIAEPLLAAVRSTDALRALIEKEQLPGGIDGLWWQSMPLQESSGPHTEWPNPEFVYIVGSGGIDDFSGDTGFDPIASAVFTDAAAAQRFAEKERLANEPVTVRTFPVGVLHAG